jgi:hypothetical protein
MTSELRRVNCEGSEKQLQSTEVITNGQNEIQYIQFQEINTRFTQTHKRLNTDFTIIPILLLKQ